MKKFTEGSFLKCGDVLQVEATGDHTVGFIIHRRQTGACVGARTAAPPCVALPALRGTSVFLLEASGAPE